jgi:hypothetical protein
MPVCGLPKHVTGQKKTNKIHGSLAISPANTQNVAQQKEGPVCFRLLASASSDRYRSAYPQNPLAGAGHDIIRRVQMPGQQEENDLSVP